MEAPPEDRVNLQIESSPIQLGLIQGFTTALTNVTGTLQANVQVTGSAGDPHPGGSIAVSDAGFTVGASGVNYSGGSGRIEFQGDRVHIDQFRLLDNQRKPLVVSGDLAIHERELGGVDVSVKATDFKVIDNKIGNVRINSDLHIAGELSYPRVEGDLGINTGMINLDELLAATTESAYSTTPIEAPGADPASAERAGQSSASVFDALQMDIHVTIPNDLVVKGSDLRVPDAPVGLGALNVTLGGDLWVSKTPWDRPRLTGPVNTVRGTYDFQGRRFDILRDGTLRFDGLDELEPLLDVRAERLIQGVRTNVNLRGTLRHPDVVLTSSPPLEQSDILALIVFNQPANQIGAGQQISLAQRAQSMALGAVAGQLASSIGGALDLNTFEVQIAPDSGAAAQVTVGQQVGQNLFVKVEQGIGDQTHHQCGHRVSVGQLAVAADQRAAGRHDAATVSTGSGKRDGSDFLLQLLTTKAISRPDSVFDKRVVGVLSSRPDDCEPQRAQSTRRLWSRIPCPACACGRAFYWGGLLIRERRPPSTSVVHLLTIVAERHCFARISICVATLSLSCTTYCTVTAAPDIVARPATPLSAPITFVSGV